jgi:cytosine/adenosine deaminase-related metal-dependent hydrolase
MFQEMRLALRLHRPPGLGAPALTSEDVLRMATLEGARALGLDGLVGSLEPGKRADLVLLRLDRICEPYCDPEVPPLELIVHRAKGQDVDAVLVDGRAAIEGGRLRSVDRAGVVAGLQEAAAARLTPGAREVRALMADLAPHIQKFFAAWDLPAAHACYGVNSLI